VGEGEPYTDRLLHRVHPHNAANAVTWSSSNTNVATVAADGTVTGVATGCATITARTVDGGKTAVCQVTVVLPVRATGVALSGTPTYNVLVGDSSRSLFSDVEPWNATNQNVTWASSDPSVAMVTSDDDDDSYYDSVADRQAVARGSMRKVTGVAPGMATITATTQDGGFTASCIVFVIGDDYIPADGVSLDQASMDRRTAFRMALCDNGMSLDQASMDLAVGGPSGTIAAAIQPSNATYKNAMNVVWKSYNPSVATVSGNGLVATVTPVAAGMTIIAVVTAGVRPAECLVTVTDDNVSSGDVYVAWGTYPDRATLWRNGVPQPLCDAYAEANAVFVSGSDVYVAGRAYLDGVGVRATLWKNGIPQPLGVDDAKACSVFVSGDDVYVAGVIYGSKFRAALWKNGIPQPLDGACDDDCFADSVFVSGGDVYVAGRIGDLGATLWKNGVPQPLDGGSANSVFVSGDDVYVAGESEWRATLWKNGVPQRFGFGSANSVFVSSGDVYVAGLSLNRATLWKNGVQQRLSDVEAEVNSLFVSGDDVYVAGEVRGWPTTRSHGCLWKNGVPLLMAGDSSFSFSSVFVKQAEPAGT
jgi:uncharacterized protein YjdB